MSRLLPRLRFCRQDAKRSDAGATIVEYALLTAVFGIAVITGLGTIRGQFSSAYDNRQPQYGAPHATNQTTTTAIVGSTTSSSSTSSTSSTSSSSTTSSTLASTTTTTAPPVNLSYWWHTTANTSGGRWQITTQMYVLRTNGQPYASTTVTVSYFDINQFPIGSATGTTNSQGYLQVVSPTFKRNQHARVFAAVTNVGGSNTWEGTLTGWVNRPA